MQWTQGFVLPKFRFTPCTHVWILVSVEEAYIDPKVKLSPPSTIWPCALVAQDRCCIKLAAAHHNLGSYPATPSRLGGFTSKSNKCESHKSRLISSAQGLLCSLVLSSIQLSQPNSRIYTNHTISQREVGESSTMATKLLGTTSNQQNRAWNSSPPRRGLRGINSQSQQN